MDEEGMETGVGVVANPMKISSGDAQSRGAVEVELHEFNNPADDKLPSQAQERKRSKFPPIKRISAFDVSQYHVYTSKSFLDEILSTPRGSKQKKMLGWLFLSTFVMAREECFQRKTSYYVMLAIQTVTICVSVYCFIVSIFIMTDSANIIRQNDSTGGALVFINLVFFILLSTQAAIKFYFSKKLHSHVLDVDLETFGSLQKPTGYYVFFSYIVWVIFSTSLSAMRSEFAFDHKIPTGFFLAYLQLSMYVVGNQLIGTYIFLFADVRSAHKLATTCLEHTRSQSFTFAEFAVMRSIGGFQLTLLSSSKFKITFSQSLTSNPSQLLHQTNFHFSKLRKRRMTCSGSS